jgi:hypothetical protein
MVKKGRLCFVGWESTRGASHRNAKLSEAVARMIKFGEADARKVAETLGISKQTVHDIRAGRRWKHLK